LEPGRSRSGSAAGAVSGAAQPRWPV